MYKRQTHSAEPAIRFAALICDIRNHEAGVFDDAHLSALCDRLRVPNAVRELGSLALRYSHRAQATSTLDAVQRLELLETLDAFRRAERLEQFLQVCAIEAGAHDLQDSSAQLGMALGAARSVDTASLQQQGYSGKALGAALREARIEAIRKLMQGGEN